VCVCVFFMAIFEDGPLCKQNSSFVLHSVCTVNKNNIFRKLKALYEAESINITLLFPIIALSLC
jgi:hypothetical protein